MHDKAAATTPSARALSIDVNNNNKWKKKRGRETKAATCHKLLAWATRTRGKHKGATRSQVPGAAPRPVRPRPLSQSRTEQTARQTDAPWQAQDYDCDCDCDDTWRSQCSDMQTHARRPQPSPRRTCRFYAPSPPPTHNSPLQRGVNGANG